MGAVFVMQGFGQLAGALVMLFVVLGLKESLLTAATFCQDDRNSPRAHPAPVLG